jgi:hypothetical protein
VAIAIPSFRNRPPESYNYLPRHAHASLLSIIRNRFDIQLWKDLHQFGHISKRQDELICNYSADAAVHAPFSNGGHGLPCPLNSY